LNASTQLSVIVPAVPVIFVKSIFDADNRVTINPINEKSAICAEFVGLLSRPDYKFRLNNIQTPQHPSLRKYPRQACSGLFYGLQNNANGFFI